jgi:hypothetical protein
MASRIPRHLAAYPARRDQNAAPGQRSIGLYGMGAPSGAPTTTETALTSGYLLVEARSPLPGAPRVSSRQP